MSDTPDHLGVIWVGTVNIKKNTNRIFKTKSGSGNTVFFCKQISIGLHFVEGRKILQRARLNLGMYLSGETTCAQNFKPRKCPGFQRVCTAGRPPSTTSNTLYAINRSSDALRHVIELFPMLGFILQTSHQIVDYLHSLIATH